MLSSDYDWVPVGWMSRGACRGEDPELFFPIAATGPALDQVSAAKAVCDRCVVRAMCLAYALATRQAGIWGGTTGDERYPASGPPGRRARQQAGRLAGPHAAPG